MPVIRSPEATTTPNSEAIGLAYAAPPGAAPSWTLWIVIILATLTGSGLLVWAARCARQRRRTTFKTEKQLPPAPTPKYIPLTVAAAGLHQQQGGDDRALPPMEAKFEASLLAHGDAPNLGHYRPALFKGANRQAPNGLPQKPRPWSLRPMQRKAEAELPT